MRSRYNLAVFAKPTLSISLAGLNNDPAAPWFGGARAAISWAAAAGFRCIQLDATAPGIRPRELGRSARRDLAAFLRRSELSLSGVDLWIPPEHFMDPTRVSRAVDAANQAAELAGELARWSGGGGGFVSVVFPSGLAPDISGSLAESAMKCGAELADHRLAASPTAKGPDGAAVPSHISLGTGIDPAAALLAGQDPSILAARAGARLLAARLSDASLVSRVTPGSAGGRLDEMAYLAALSVAGFKRPLVLDLRGVSHQASAAAAVLGRW